MRTSRRSPASSPTGSTRPPTNATSRATAPTARSSPRCRRARPRSAASSCSPTAPARGSPRRRRAARIPPGAAAPARSTDTGVPLAAVLGRVSAPAALDAQTETAEATRPDGARWLLASYSLHAPNGRVVALAPREAALATWRSDTVLTVTLFTTTGFVLLILGFAFHWQATRAREADLIYDTVRGRIDTALNRGRCGLWDWDLARGRIFWSHSIFDILGLPPRDDLLTFGEVSALVHPADVKLYELAAQLADATTKSIDRAFRMRHAAGDWA